MLGEIQGLSFLFSTNLVSPSHLNAYIYIKTLDNLFHVEWKQSDDTEAWENLETYDPNKKTIFQN